MKHLNENSILNVPSNDHLTCENIWKNLLFLDNFGPYSERVSEIRVSYVVPTDDLMPFNNLQCSLWTWYISVELQFFVVSLLVMMLSKTSRKFAFIIFLGFFVSTFFTTTAIGVNSNRITEIS